MSLSNFFRVNMPYGMMRNDHKEWFVYNREYLPLGWSKSTLGNLDRNSASFYTSYKGITTKLLEKVADGETSISRNDKGEIIQVWFYSDKTNPSNKSSDKTKYWNEYSKKMELLGSLLTVA